MCEFVTAFFNHGWVVVLAGDCTQSWIDRVFGELVRHGVVVGFLI